MLTVQEGRPARRAATCFGQGACVKPQPPLKGKTMRRSPTRTMMHAQAVAAALALAAMCAAGCGQPEPQRAATPAPEGGQTGQPAVRFQATVYEVRVPPARLGELDAKALSAQGPTATGLEKALAAIGPTKPLYQVDQPVNPVKDMITVGTRTPMVTGSRMAESGGRINTVQYQQVGVIFKFGGSPGAVLRGRILDVKLGIEISAVTGSNVEIGTGVKAVNIRSYSLTYTGPVELGHPFVCISVDATSRDEDGSAVAYICRAVLSEQGP